MIKRNTLVLNNSIYGYTFAFIMILLVAGNYYIDFSQVYVTLLFVVSIIAILALSGIASVGITEHHKIMKDNAATYFLIAAFIFTRMNPKLTKVKHYFLAYNLIITISSIIYGAAVGLAGAGKYDSLIIPIFFTIYTLVVTALLPMLWGKFYKNYK